MQNITNGILDVTVNENGSLLDSVYIAARNISGRAARNRGNRKTSSSSPSSRALKTAGIPSTENAMK